jgi:hypothetical protein
LRGSSRHSSLTSLPTPNVRVPRLVARLIVDYYVSRRLVVNFFAYAARPGALTRRAARRRLHRLTHAHRRLLRLRRAFGCPGTSRGSSRGSSSTTLPRAGSSSPTSPMMCDRVPRLLARLVVDHTPSRRSTCCPVALALTMCPVAPSLGSTTPSTTARLLSGRTSSSRASGHCVSRCDYSSSGLHRLYCSYAVHRTRRLDARLLSVGRSGSRRVPGHSVVRRNYLSHTRSQWI